MTLKILSRSKKNYTRYKSSKSILTPTDIEEADRFDNKLNNVIDQIEKVLLDRRLLSEKGTKKDPLLIWYIIGTEINRFLKENNLNREDEVYFWENLYNRSVLINKNIPKNKISLARNDFKTASILAKYYSFDYVSKVGPWALWREILSYKVFQDKRIFKWLIRILIKMPRTRDEARPLLKAIADRFKRIDTFILNKKELLSKLGDIKR
jgi:hypothetical protein